MHEIFRSTDQPIDFATFWTCNGSLNSYEKSIANNARDLQSANEREFAEQADKPFLDGARLRLRIPHDDPNYKNKQQLLNQATTRLNNAAQSERWIVRSDNEGHAIELIDQGTMPARIANDAKDLQSANKHEFAEQADKPFLDGARLVLWIPHGDPNYKNKQQLLNQATTRLNNAAQSERWIVRPYNYGLAIEPTDQNTMTARINHYLDCEARARGIDRKKFLIIYADGGGDWHTQQAMSEVRGFQHKRSKRGCRPGHTVTVRTGYTILNNQLGGTYSNDPSVANAGKFMKWLEQTLDINHT